MRVCISYANDNSLSYIEFLELLCEDETNSRRDNSYKKRYHKAKLPAYKNIEDFDFSFQPSIDKKLINDAFTCQFIAAECVGYSRKKTLVLESKIRYIHLS